MRGKAKSFIAEDGGVKSSGQNPHVSQKRRDVGHPPEDAEAWRVQIKTPTLSQKARQGWGNRARPGATSLFGMTSCVAGRL